MPVVNGNTQIFMGFSYQRYHLGWFRVMGHQIIAVLSEVCELGDKITSLISGKRGVVCSSLSQAFWSSDSRKINVYLNAA